ncbi:MAG: thiamine pyrophosphate-binding protein [Deltaproteobacteria bacterium]|nr:thiamine pyrophosphate-binding protein [Deltaproteobacteria bacterium]
MADKKGNRAFLEALVAEHVRHIFGNPGSSEVPWLDVLPDYPSLNYVLALHEAIGVAMADGYAWASGSPGVVSLHAAPGIAHGLGNIFNAYYSRTPLVVLLGEQPSRLLNRDPFLGSGLLEIAKPWVKWACRITSADEIAYGVHRAFKEATDPPTGPALISIPRDYLDETVKEEIPHALTRSLGKKVRPDREELRRAAEYLVRAKSPALLSGPQAERVGALPLIIELANLLAIRLYDDSRYPCCLPTTHSYHLGTYSKAAGERADLLIVVGQSLFIERQIRDLGLIPPGLAVIHIDADPGVIGKNHPVAVGLYGDPRACIEELLSAVRELGGESLEARARERAREIEEEKVRREDAKRKEMAERWERIPVSPVRLIGELRRALPADAIVIDEASGSHGFLRRFFDFPGPGLHYVETAGCLGWGLPAALGVKLAKPEREVVAFVGDGSFLYYPQALWTACRYGIPVVAVICNNRSYLNDKIFLKLRGGPAAQQSRYETVDITEPNVDVVRCAQAMGAAAERVERPEALAGALAGALAQKRPAVLDVHVDPWEWGPHEM